MKKSENWIVLGILTGTLLALLKVGIVLMVAPEVIAQMKSGAPQRALASQ